MQVPWGKYKDTEVCDLPNWYLNLCLNKGWVVGDLKEAMVEEYNKRNEDYHKIKKLEAALKYTVKKDI